MGIEHRRIRWSVSTRLPAMRIAAWRIGGDRLGWTFIG
jgi:hypothetical protein